MSVVYSKRLLYLADSSARHASAVVPDGFVWVVRDMCATQMNIGPGAAQGVQVSVFTAGFDRYQLWDLPDADTRGLVTYRWEGHQVLSPGDNLQVDSAITHWTVVISGYQLSLP